MGGDVFFSFFFSLMVNYCISPCTGHWITDLKSEMFSNITDDVTEKGNQNEFPEKLFGNNSSITTETNIFWTISDVNINTSETSLESQIDSQDIKPVESDDKLVDSEENRNDTNSTSTNAETDQTSENSSHAISPSETNAPDFITYEKIVLQRNNCHLEISISEAHDLKIEIRFGKLENNTSGQCCITLNGHKNNMLGALISNIHLYKDAFQEEVLKVITANYGLDFVVKEYHSWSKYEPLLLTETHKVYVVLYYNVTNVPINEEDTHFNLEVFSYRKYENYNQMEDYSKSDNSYN